MSLADNLRCARKLDSKDPKVTFICDLEYGHDGWHQCSWQQKSPEDGKYYKQVLRWEEVDQTEENNTLDLQR